MVEEPDQGMCPSAAALGRATQREETGDTQPGVSPHCIPQELPACRGGGCPGGRSRIQDPIRHQREAAWRDLRLLLMKWMMEVRWPDHMAQCPGELLSVRPSGVTVGEPNP